MIADICKVCNKQVYLERTDGKTYSFDDMCCWNQHECIPQKTKKVKLRYE